MQIQTSQIIDCIHDSLGNIQLLVGAHFTAALFHLITVNESSNGRLPIVKHRHIYTIRSQHLLSTPTFQQSFLIWATSVTGGAIALHSSIWSFAASANVTFINNSAWDKGGALYTVWKGIIPNMVISFITPPCFYHLLNCNDNATYNIFFANNLATNGGDNSSGAGAERELRLQQSQLCVCMYICIRDMYA